MYSQKPQTCTDMLKSNAEHSFILSALSEGKRLDGRKLDERRDLTIHFGREWGTTEVKLGETRVLASTSCSVGEPQSSRPNEGVLKIRMEPLAKRSMTTEALVELNRVIERKVWIISLEMTILNDAGNAADCASVAGLAALCHFKRPDVTLKGDKIRIHPFTNGIRVALSDPSRDEEVVMDGKVVLGMNPYREICALHLAGQKLVDKRLVLQLASKAAEYAKNIVNKLKNELKLDEKARKMKENPCLANAIREEATLFKHLKDTHDSLDVKKWSSVKEPPSLSEGVPVTITEPTEGVYEMIPVDTEVVKMEDDEEEEVITVKGSDMRVKVGYWILGLCNNFGYVVMLSSAMDILNPSHINGENFIRIFESQTNATNPNPRDCNPISTGAVLLADVIPTIIIKILIPFVSVGFHFRIAAESTFAGIVCTSLASGLGELSFLGLMSRFPESVVSFWSSGTGAAGIAGATTYAFMTGLGISSRTTLLCMLVVPLIMAFTFWFVVYPKAHQNQTASTLGYESLGLF
ncbi:RRP45 [Lepeophtheirus salmonis]|uniref:Battenin n=1 Tax=Lepeophtheirus salmonis TaxID=72036 RepID=A0A7R8CG04_LEPSM|nr:RRP45 [Lepeophtheirus salmonis]CAF2806124.1 RRP45 [Lepeophtheirus salmonis]